MEKRYRVKIKNGRNKNWEHERLLVVMMLVRSIEILTSLIQNLTKLTAWKIVRDHVRLNLTTSGGSNMRLISKMHGEASLLTILGFGDGVLISSEIELFSHNVGDVDVVDVDSVVDSSLSSGRLLKIQTTRVRKVSRLGHDRLMVGSLRNVVTDIKA